MHIVEGWPRNFDTRRALSLGFRADATFDDIVRIHVEDELSKRRKPRPRPGSRVRFIGGRLRRIRRP